MKQNVFGFDGSEEAVVTSCWVSHRAFLSLQCVITSLVERGCVEI